MKGFYIHIKTKILYNVLGISRCINNPNKKYVIYEQLFFKKEGEHVYDFGSIWHGKVNDFNKNFSKITSLEIDEDGKLRKNV